MAARRACRSSTSTIDCCSRPASARTRTAMDEAGLSLVAHGRRPTRRSEPRRAEPFVKSVSSAFDDTVARSLVTHRDPATHDAARTSAVRSPRRRPSSASSLSATAAPILLATRHADRVERRRRRRPVGTDRDARERPDRATSSAASAPRSRGPAATRSSPRRIAGPTRPPTTARSTTRRRTSRASRPCR